MMMANASYDPYTDSATYWTCGNRTYNGFPVRLCTLTQNANVSVVFLRLPDGYLSSLWATDSGAPFYVSPKATLTTADGANTYTQTGLIATLAAIFTDFAPARIGTLDSTFAYGDDHQDHVTSALFTLEAAHQWGARVRHAHLPRLQYRRRTRLLHHACRRGREPLAGRVRREARRHGGATGATSPTAAPSTTGATAATPSRASRADRAPSPSTGGCLDVQGGATADGTPVLATTCTGSASQVWTVTQDSKLVGPAGKCLTAGSGGAAQLATCSGERHAEVDALRQRAAPRAERHVPHRRGRRKPQRRRSATPTGPATATSRGRAEVRAARLGGLRLVERLELLRRRRRLAAGVVPFARPARSRRRRVLRRVHPPVGRPLLRRQRAQPPGHATRCSARPSPTRTAGPPTATDRPCSSSTSTATTGPTRAPARPNGIVCASGEQHGLRGADDAGRPSSPTRPCSPARPTTGPSTSRT